LKKIGIIVVTYNRLQCLKKNIQALKNLQMPHNISVNIFVINNASTDGTSIWLETLGDDNIEVITLKENTGGSGGFYTGVKVCTEVGLDYVWGMDDDAYPTESALIEILKLVDKLGDDFCYWSNCNSDKLFEDSYKMVTAWMFVGFFIPTPIIKKIGYPRNDFFIFYDDVEYSDRIQKYGYKIYKVRDSIIKHKDAYSNVYSRCFLKKKIEIPNFSNWKMYYYIRNKLLRYSKKEIQFWENFLIIIPKIIFKVIILNPKQLRIVFIAYIHGFAGKNGKVMVP